MIMKPKNTVGDNWLPLFNWNTVAAVLNLSNMVWTDLF